MMIVICPLGRVLSDAEVNTDGVPDADGSPLDDDWLGWSGGQVENKVSVGNVVVSVTGTVTGIWFVMVVVVPGMVEVIVMIVSLVHVPREERVESKQDVSVVVMVEAGKVETEVEVEVETELETVSDEPNNVEVGVGEQAILNVVQRGDGDDGEGR